MMNKNRSEPDFNVYSSMNKIFKNSSDPPINIEMTVNISETLTSARTDVYNKNKARKILP